MTKRNWLVALCMVILASIACGTVTTTVEEPTDDGRPTSSEPATSTPTPTDIPPTPTNTPVPGVIIPANISEVSVAETFVPSGVAISSIAWSEDGTRLAAASTDGIITVWDMTTRELLRASDAQAFTPTAMAWSPTNEFIAVATDAGRVLVWDSGKQIVAYELQGPANDQALQVRWSPDGDYIAAAWANSEVTVWNPLSREILYTVGLLEEIDNTVLTQEALTEEPATPTPTVTPLPGTPTATSAPPTIEASISVDFSPDSTFIAVGTNRGTVILANAEDGAVFNTANVHDSALESVEFSPSGELIAVGTGNGETSIWDVEANERVVLIRGHQGPVLRLAWSNDDRLLATADSTGAMYVWNLEERSQVRNDLIDESRNPVTGLDWSPDGMAIAVSNAIAIQLYSLGMEQ